MEYIRFLKVTNLMVFPDLNVTQFQRLTIAVLQNNRTKLNVAIWEKRSRVKLQSTKMKIKRAQQLS